MGAVLEFGLRMETMSCGECGMIFGVPGEWVRARRDEGENEGKFFCPNGHRRVFRDPKSVRLERELAQEKQRREDAERQARTAEETAKRERTSRKRLEQRARGGLCPCCGRSFTKLAAHMKTKHPEFGHGLHAKSGDSA